ncbi:MAG: type I asparaginase [Flavobacteriales bacterium]|nr:MAG: type I asparaginase [Flavobacteriales bacterium]
MAKHRRVLLIYTGGTIGMMKDPRTGALQPMDLEHLEDLVPELGNIPAALSTASLEPVMDSSDMGPADWVRIAQLIAQHPNEDGYVVLHGTDTMAYTASALSYLLEGLTKPVVLTGALLPLGVLRTDGKENLLTAIEIAAAHTDGVATLQEVAIYFEYSLYRGNRAVKTHAERFEAFRSPNWPRLAEAGVHIRWNLAAMLPKRTGPLDVHPLLDPNVGVVRLFPGITGEWVRHSLATPGLRGAVLTTFGSGNGPRNEDFLNALREARARGIVLVNATQCFGGRVEQGRYETSRAFNDMGITPASDMTVEAAVTKLMFLFGQGLAERVVQERFGVPLCGELTI